MPYDIAHAVRVVGAGPIAREHNYAGVLGYGIPYISIAAVYESLALATTVRNDCR